MKMQEKINKLKGFKDYKTRDKFILNNLNKPFAKWLYQNYPINNYEVLKELKWIIGKNN